MAASMNPIKASPIRWPNVAATSINGNNLTSLSSFLTRCGPGSVVTFDNIKVTGPGGARVIEGKSFALY